MLTNWTKDKVLGAAVVVLITTVAIYTSVETGTGKKTEVIGTVIATGVNSSQPYNLPTLLITVRLNDGDVVTVKAKKHHTPNKGDEVILVKSERRL